MLASLALKPKTMIDHTLIEIFDKNLFDMILIMTVGKFIYCFSSRAWIWWIRVHGWYATKSGRIKEKIPTD